MKVCYKCNKEIMDDFFVGRQAQCPACGADLLCCMNCSFYDAGSFNNCREPQAERVLDNIRSNFCDYFKFKQLVKSSDSSHTSSKDKLEALFKNS